MIYKKPPNVSYTDMAIAIDTHIRDESFDKELLFEYMWHLFYILAVKGKFFNSGRDYDDYALYAATQLYFRYQRERDGSGSRKLEPIKSCLNYIKKVLYPLKVNYQKEYFEHVIREEDARVEYTSNLRELREERARETARGIMRVEYEQYLRSISQTVKFVLSSTPYQKDKVMMHKLYVSCMLTLIKTITMRNDNKERLQKRVNRTLPVEELVDQIYEDESHDNVVLFHLGKEFGNYISVLTVKIRKEIAKDLRSIVGSFEPSEQVIKDILLSPIEGMGSKNE